MKLGCSTWSYAAAFRAGRIDVPAWLEVCADELPVDSVELLDLHLPDTSPETLRDIKKRCIDLNLTLAGIGVTNDFGPERGRAAEVEKVQQWCDVAAYMGAPVVRVFAGWIPSALDEPEDSRVAGFFRRVFGTRQPDRRRIWSDAAGALRQCADYAAERGIVLALQNNRSQGILGSPFELFQMLHDAGSPWLRACLDPADFANTAGIDLCVPRTVQARARIRDVREDGSDATVAWPELLRILALSGYRGHLLLDYDGAEEPETAVPRAARYLRMAMRRVEQQPLLTEAPAPQALPGENGRIEALQEPSRT